MSLKIVKHRQLNRPQRNLAGFDVKGDPGKPNGTAGIALGKLPDPDHPRRPAVR